MTSPLATNKKEEIINLINQVLGAEDKIDRNIFYQEIEKNINPDLSTEEIFKVVLLTATSLLEKDPIYDKLASHFLLQKTYWEVFAETLPNQSTYQQLFIDNIKLLVEKDILDKRLLEFDLEKLSQALTSERDKLFNYLGLETLTGDKANLLKYSGGVATDWTNLRALGSPIESIATESTGLIPFLKLANDTTGAINRSGRRRGASVAYLEDHCGVVHCSNLCTEITLNTSAQETAVCNLGSINLARHISEGKLDDNLFQETITTAIRMLDNVIDLNYYPTKEAEYSNFQHRPIGLGMMGFQDALFQLNINYNSPEALEFTDQLTEKFSYSAISASCQLARERGTYSSYRGSKWDRGIFPLDTLNLLEKERGLPIKTNRQSKLN
ncbi:8777_t:CDS:2 [Paraglomus brasilianum]|uniref:8777_t:CDS:1 n=1 Tax=Paraglomus brasilianum TaxID=144538 RepID=A0A9N9ASH8_9GLOM|nr:8777_t:CDS:2 [Paraglomus brasilianum]